ncbi:MAG: phospho-N-acetylmuramoyl-pentapeptide-transferase [Armatimonadetes bacterium]|nr:phospho-N-acetylmuramoyl-pentapeptide-transferase [Armatimonadota bacterium]
MPQAFAFLVSFLAALVLGPMVIEGLRVLKFGQNINYDAPARHLQKQGTPTMGGVLMVLGVGITLLAGVLFTHWLRPPSPQLVAVVLVFLAHALLGFADDYLKIRRGKSLGLLARQKLAGQVVITLAFVAYLFLTAQRNFTTEVVVWRGQTWDWGYGYYVFAFLLMIGLSNAVNLTDGLDGLAGGLALLAALGLAWAIHVLPAGFDQLPLFNYALAGSCLGFLWYNAHPAKVFMGDTGSLAIGGSLAAMALLSKQELVLLVFAAMFLLEIGSVILQVLYFKATKGKRIFKMSPLHHHFELSGVEETQVVARFWIGGVIALTLGLLLSGFVWVLPGSGVR